MTRFQDKAHRADLAYAMLSLAETCNKQKFIAQRLYDPEMWYWLETDNYCGVYFAGAPWFYMIDEYTVADGRAQAMIYQVDRDNEIQLPRFDHKNNYESVVCYAVSLLCGQFKTYGKDELVYDPIEFRADTDSNLVWNLRGKTNYDVARESIAMMGKDFCSEALDFDKTLNTLTELFSVQGYQHGDLEKIRREQERSQFQVNPYAYLNEAKFAAREQIVKDCFKYGRAVVFKNNSNTLFPRSH